MSGAALNQGYRHKKMYLCHNLIGIHHNTLTMTTEKKFGIWMDHSNAHLIEFEKESSLIRTINTNLTHEGLESTLGNSENVMHNKQQHHQASFYKKLADEIIHFDEVLLFGPTDAKSELFNILKADAKFNKIKIDVKPADKMTENQQQAFVNEHFSMS